jgi:hypothetical protein
MDLKVTHRIFPFNTEFEPGGGRAKSSAVLISSKNTSTIRGGIVETRHHAKNVRGLSPPGICGPLPIKKSLLCIGRPDKRHSPKAFIFRWQDSQVF